MTVKSSANGIQLSVQNEVLLLTWLLLVSKNPQDQLTSQWFVIGKRHAVKCEKNEKLRIKASTLEFRREPVTTTLTHVLIFSPQLPTLVLDTSAHLDSNLCFTFFSFLSFVFLPVTLCRTSGWDSHNLAAVNPRGRLGPPCHSDPSHLNSSSSTLLPHFPSWYRFRTWANSLGVPMFMGCLDFWTPKNGGGISIYTTSPQTWRSHHWFPLNPYIHEFRSYWRTGGQQTDYITDHKAIILTYSLLHDPFSLNSSKNSKNFSFW